MRRLGGWQNTVVKMLGVHSPREHVPMLDYDPPAGLFVVDERTVYLRSLGRITIGHEVGHAIDCALGDGAYLSTRDPNIRAAYSGARAFVTPYAASAIDEYMAEALRAYADDLNDDHSPWPPATRKHLRSCDPRVCDPTALRFYGYLRRNRETTFRRVSVALDLTEQTVRTVIDFEAHAA